MLGKRGKKGGGGTRSRNAIFFKRPFANFTLGTGFVFYATLVLETLKNLEGEREEKTIILILIFRKIKILFMGRECICTFFCDSLL